MAQILQNILKTLIESFQINIIKFSKDWFILTRILLYTGAALIYLIAFIVLASVTLIILVIAAPVSILYKFFF